MMLPAKTCLLSSEWRYGTQLQILPAKMLILQIKPWALHGRFRCFFSREVVTLTPAGGDADPDCWLMSWWYPYINSPASDHHKSWDSTRSAQIIQHTKSIYIYITCVLPAGYDCQLPRLYGPNTGEHTIPWNIGIAPWSISSISSIQIQPIRDALRDQGCWSKSGWNRVIVEKPFGKNGPVAMASWIDEKSWGIHRQGPTVWCQFLMGKKTEIIILQYEKWKMPSWM